MGPQVLLAGLVFFTVARGGDLASPVAIAGALRSCLPMVAIYDYEDSVQFHVDTPLPSGGTLVWSRPGLSERWDVMEHPAHPQVALTFARIPPDEAEQPHWQTVRANRARIVDCFVSVQL